MDEKLRSRVLYAAQELYEYGSDDNIEIDKLDAEAVVEAGDSSEGDGRWWVKAWVYVRQDDLGDADEEA